MKKIFIGAVFVALVFGMAPATVSAMTISPPVIEFDARPGDTIVDVIKLYNETKETITMTATVQTFKALDETGAPAFSSVEQSTGLATWVKMDESTVTLAPEERKDVLFAINVPKDAEPGGHYAGILWTTGAGPTAAGQTGVGLVIKTGTLLLVRVAGAVNETGMLASFAADRQSYNYLPVNFSVRFQNSGNVHVKPVGVIEIRNMLGAKVASLPVNEDQSNVLPDSIRKFDVTWQKTAVEADTPEWQKEKDNFAFGRYTATLILNYGLESQVLSAKVTFWVFPWRITLFALAVILILILILIQGIRSYNKWLIKKYSQTQNVQNQNQKTV